MLSYTRGCKMDKIEGTVANTASRGSEGMKPLTYRLRLPGPTTVPERVRMALAQPMLNHRGPEFKEILTETELLTKKILKTQSDVLFFASSGTGAMEASLANVIDPGDRVLVVVNGQWGERFAGISNALGAQVETIDVPWGTQADPELVAKKAASRDYRAVLVTHSESSTGVVADLAALGSLLKDRPALLIVDAVSSPGAVNLQQDNWGLDIVISASQKALMCPPGLSLVSLSSKAWRTVERESRSPCFYWDFRKYKRFLGKGETPYTSPVSLIVALREALRMIHEEGLPQVLARHRKLAAAFRAGTDALGLFAFPAEDALSDSVAAIRMPTELEGDIFVRHLYEHYRTVIAGSRNRLSNRVVRVGTMGYLDASDILSDLLYMENSLRDLGWRVPNYAGVDAAATVLRT